ncbi:hypothetical protein PAMA_017877 [Pampus argenteus]
MKEEVSDPEQNAAGYCSTATNMEAKNRKRKRFESSRRQIAFSYSSRKKGEKEADDGSREAGRRLDDPPDGRREDGKSATGPGLRLLLLLLADLGGFFWGSSNNKPRCHRGRAREWSRSALGTEI